MSGLSQVATEAGTVVDTTTEVDITTAVDGNHSNQLYPW